MQRIEDGTLGVGSVLPPEPELAERLESAGRRLNQALTNLARRGAVTRRRGVGTFFRTPVRGTTARWSVIASCAPCSLREDSPTTRLPGLSHHRRETGVVAAHRRYHIGLAHRTEPGFDLLTVIPSSSRRSHLAAACGDALPLDRLQNEVLFTICSSMHCGFTVTPRRERRCGPSFWSSPRLSATRSPLPVRRHFLWSGRASRAIQPSSCDESTIRGDRYRFRARLEGHAPARTSSACPPAGAMP